MGARTRRQAVEALPVVDGVLERGARGRRDTVGAHPESVVAAYVLTGLHVVVHFVSVPAEVAAPLCRIAAPATSRPALAMIAAFALLVDYFALARAALTDCLLVAAQSGVQHIGSGHETVLEQ